jgi:hypothetical protein
MVGLVGSASRLASLERAEPSRFSELVGWASRAEPSSLRERAAASRARLGSFPPLVLIMYKAQAIWSSYYLSSNAVRSARRRPPPPLS